MIGAHPGNWMRTFFEESQMEAINFSELIKLVAVDDLQLTVLNQ